ncbi:MAG: class I SAM-dependent methyltransferase [Thermonemataceae bacterium]
MKEELRNIYYRFLRRKKSNDVYALTALQTLLDTPSIIPISTSAIRPHSLYFMINDILINQRKNLIEFGAGVSTVVIARLIKRNNLTDTHLYSVEHDAQWIALLKTSLALEGLTDYVTFIHSELQTSDEYLPNLTWYNTTTIKTIIEQQENFDFVFIDGPIADGKMKRYPALPFMQKHLNSSYAVFLDDANRGAEKKILKKWRSECNVTYKYANYSFAYILTGTSYNIIS